jgi:hypothetical protein
LLARLLTHEPPAHPPADLLTEDGLSSASSKCAWGSSADQTEYFLAGTTLGKKKKINKKEETKLQNPEPPAHKKLLHATLHRDKGGLQHHQTLAPNLPRRQRQTGLDIKE